MGLTLVEKILGGGHSLPTPVFFTWRNPMVQEHGGLTVSDTATGNSMHAEPVNSVLIVSGKQRRTQPYIYVYPSILY